MGSVDRLYANKDCGGGAMQEFLKDMAGNSTYQEMLTKKMRHLGQYGTPDGEKVDIADPFEEDADPRMVKLMENEGMSSKMLKNAPGDRDVVVKMGRTGTITVDYGDDKIRHVQNWESLTFDERQTLQYEFSFQAISASV